MDQFPGFVGRYLDHFPVAADQFSFSPGDDGDDGSTHLAFENLGLGCHFVPPFVSIKRACRPLRGGRPH
jgi:hypothetical protein